MRMRGKGVAGFFGGEEVANLVNHIKEEKPLLPLVIPLVLGLWVVERWLFSFSNWVPLVLAVWATYQYCSYQQKVLVEDLNKKWKRLALKGSPVTPLEPCEWLNKLVMEIWQSYLCPKFSVRFSSIVEKRLKWNKPNFIERIELQEFLLGSSPPSLGLQGTRWSTLGGELIMRLGFDWDTNDISIMLMAKLAKPLAGTARIVINSLHIKGDLLLRPVLDGRAVLYSFLSTPEIRTGVAFGSGGSQSLPSTELPGVSSWLVKLFTDTLVKTMVEPRRQCFSLPAVDLRKKAVGGSIHVTVVSANHLSRSIFRGSQSKKQQGYSVNGGSEEHHDDKDLRTFVEVELGKLTRKTEAKTGSSPRWDSPFNMVLHSETGIIRFNIYNCTPGSVRCDFLGSCEIKMKYVADDSTTFWAIGPDFSVIAKHAEFCGKEVEMVVPVEGIPSGELAVKLMVKDWHFADGSYSLQKSNVGSQSLLHGSSSLSPGTGRKISVTVVEGKDFPGKERSGKCDPYIKLQYGKVIHKTKVAHASNPFWNQKFEFNEIGGGEYLKLKAYGEDTFADDSLGSARVNLEGLVDGSIRDVWIPLENVNSGEVRLQIEAARVNDPDGSKGSNSGSNNGVIELVLIAARDLIAADLRGTSDPYVRVHYGNLKKRTKVMYKTLTPQWNQTLEFPDDGSPLELHVKDHNALLPTSSIGNCVVEYQRLPPNQTSDKWIPLQGVKRGEIHIRITRRVPEAQKRNSLDSEASLSKPHEASSAQMRQLTSQFQSLIEESNLEGLSSALSELESLQDTHDDYILQLETERTLLLNKIRELGEEIMGSSSSASLSRGSSSL